MSLVVYSNGSIYADRKILLIDMNGDRTLTEGDKIIDCGKKLAVAILGPVPTAKDLRQICSFLGYAIWTYETTGHFTWFRPDSVVDRTYVQMTPEEITDFAFSHGESSYFILTNRMCYQFDRRGISILDPVIEYAHGSGQTLFATCRRAGLTIEQSYEKIAMYEHTVGDDIDVAHSKDYPDIRAMNEADAIKRGNLNEILEMRRKALNGRRDLIAK